METLRALWKQLDTAAETYPLAALLGALAIPAQCAELDSPALNSADAYRRWFDTWVAPVYIEHPDMQPVLDGEICYSYRLGLRRLERHDQQWLPIRFVVGHPDVTMHRVTFDGILYIEIRPFVHDVVQGAERWLVQYAATHAHPRTPHSALLAAWPE